MKHQPMQSVWRKSFAMALLAICGFVVFFPATSIAAAQARRSMLGGARGAVRLSNGNAVEGVGVELISSKTAIRTTVYSNADGKYEFPVLDIGEYTLRVPSPHEYKPYVREPVRIDGATEMDDIILERVSETEFVPPTPENLAQLTGAEWMMNLPAPGKKSAYSVSPAGLVAIPTSRSFAIALTSRVGV